MKRIKIPDEIKKMVFDIYNNQCPFSGERDKRKLQIHHLDHNPGNNKIDNLILVSYEIHALMYHPERAEEMYEWYENTFEKGLNR